MFLPHILVVQVLQSVECPAMYKEWYMLEQMLNQYWSFQLIGVKIGNSPSSSAMVSLKEPSNSNTFIVWEWKNVIHVFQQACIAI